jgi:hypothetical protein
MKMDEKTLARQCKFIMVLPSAVRLYRSFSTKIVFFYRIKRVSLVLST